nr:hypothetical protein [Rhodococcus erythropolis]
MTSPQPEPTLTFTPKRVAQLAFVLIGCQLVIRAWVAASNYFYWDDLILMGRGGRFPLFSSELLLYDHDGHFMPAAFFFTGLITRIAPYNWALSATLLVIGQAAASLALLRTLRLVLGWRPALLIPLILYLFVPLTLPSFSWWAAALNALPLQIALAWACGDAIKLYRTGHVRYVFSGTAVFVVSLLFFEKAVLVPFVALAFLVLYLRTQGEGTPIRSAVTKCRRLWTACAAVLAIWIPVYLTTVESPITGNGRSMSTELLHHGTSLGMLPTLLGGPWRWERWIPSPAWADPPTVLVAAAWVALLTTVVMTVRARRGAAWIWVAAALYFLASVVAMTATRSDADTTYELAQTLRYFTDSATVFALAAALILAAPRVVRPGYPSQSPPACRRSSWSVHSSRPSRSSTSGARTRLATTSPTREYRCHRIRMLHCSSNPSRSKCSFPSPFRTIWQAMFSRHCLIAPNSLPALRFCAPSTTADGLSMPK